MANCPQCGELLDEGARFCAECGAPAPRVRDEAGLPAERAVSPDHEGVASDAGRPLGSGAATSGAGDTVVMPAAVPSPSENARRRADATRALDSLGPSDVPGGGVRPVTGPVSVGSGSTRRMPPVATPQARPVGSRRPVTYSARNTVSRSRVPLVVGIVLAALLVSAGGFAAVMIANRDAAGPGASATSFLFGDEATDAPAPAQDLASDPSGGQTPATPEKLETPADDAQAASLAAFYDGLPALDQEVGAAAQEFNGLYISGSLEDRKAALSRCEELRADIAEARDEVRALSVPAESPYHGCAEDIAALYEDLYQRIDVIIKSWEIDVGYDDPAGHGDEICAPMAAANEGGVSRYLKDYQERYPGADPVKVDA